MMGGEPTLFIELFGRMIAAAVGLLGVQAS
jgi:hypothetical protein